MLFRKANKLNAILFLGLIFCLFFIEVNCPRFSHAYSFPMHKKVWFACLGIERDSRNTMDRFLSRFTKAIDQTFNLFEHEKKSLYRRIQESANFPGLKLSGDHRELFHCGFNGIAENSYLLAKDTEKAAKHHSWEPDSIFQFLKYAWVGGRGARGRRNLLIEDCVHDLGIKNKKEAKAFCTLIYDIHILSDFESDDPKAILALISLKRLKAEMIGDALLPLFSGKAVSIIRQIKRKTKRVNSQNDNRNKHIVKKVAQDMLNVLLEDLPNLVYDKYSISFDKIGIILNPDMSHKMIDWKLR